MIIPNDKGKNWRRNKYIEYSVTVPPIEPQTYTNYLIKYKFNYDDCILTGLLNSTCYSTVTSLFIYYNIDFYNLNEEKLIEFWNKNKQNMIFTSARKYVKYKNNFIDLIKTFIEKTNKKPYEWIMKICNDDDEIKNYNNIYDEMKTWKHMGRFSIELFIEFLIYMKNYKLIPNLKINSKQFDFKHGSNITSGLLNILYLDKEADEFDKTGVISKENFEKIETELKEIQKEYQNKYPEKDSSFSTITPKLCSFRNLFKGRRYGGFHHDRQLEQIMHYKKHYKNNIDFLNNILELRKEIFLNDLLGELNDWDGIRTERKKLFLKYGLTGIETNIKDKMKIEHNWW